MSTFNAGSVISWVNAKMEVQFIELDLRLMVEFMSATASMANYWILIAALSVLIGLAIINTFSLNYRSGVCSLFGTLLLGWGAAAAIYCATQLGRLPGLEYTLLIAAAAIFFLCRQVQPARWPKGAWGETDKAPLES